MEHNLSRGKLETAKQVAQRTMIICVLASIVFSLLLLDTRRYLAWCLSLDETLESMIQEIIPYIAVCQPFITVGVTAEYLNETLGMHSIAVMISTVIDMCFTIPLAAIFTYVLNYNIEGLSSALCMGYAACGVTNWVLFAQTNWKDAAAKIQAFIED